MKTRSLLALSACILAAAPAAAQPARDAIIAGLSAEAKAAQPAFAGFSAQRGRALYLAKHTGGKPDTPSCTTCHTANPTAKGETRAGKAIDPLAVSVMPARFTDPEKVAKWFLRNCTSVLGRECTAIEKGDFLTFMSAQ